MYSTSRLNTLVFGSFLHKRQCRHWLFLCCSSAIELWRSVLRTTTDPKRVFGIVIEFLSNTPAFFSHNLHKQSTQPCIEKSPTNAGSFFRDPEIPRTFKASVAQQRMGFSTAPSVVLAASCYKNTFSCGHALDRNNGVISLGCRLLRPLPCIGRKV